MDRTPQPDPPSRRLTTVIVGTVAATLVIAVSAWTLAPRESRASGPGGPGLSIAVVPPVEPEPIAGEVLEVGTLNDAFDRAALERQPQVTDVEYMPPDAYAGESWSEPRMPQPQTQPSVAASTEVALVTSTDPLADGSRLFGFDRRASVATATGSHDDAPPQTRDTITSESFFR